MMLSVERYFSGTLTIEFIDGYGFIMYSTETPGSDLVGAAGRDGSIDHFIYTEKTKMNTAVDNARKIYDVSASLQQPMLY